MVREFSFRDSPHTLCEAVIGMIRVHIDAPPPQGLATRLDLGSAAVNEEFDTCNETGIIRSEKPSHLGNFLWLSHASHRDSGHNPCNHQR